MNNFIAMLLLCFSLTPSLMAATVNDLVGTWTVDTALTWDKMQALPQLSSLSAEQKAMAKTMFVSQIGIAEFTFTSTTLTSNLGGVKKYESYKIIDSTPAGITCESTDELGAVTRSVVQIEHNVLIISNLADPLQVVILKRK
jgi:hypothetical protein